jgi:hypothetical protein
MPSANKEVFRRRSFQTAPPAYFYANDGVYAVWTLMSFLSARNPPLHLMHHSFMKNI